MPAYAAALVGWVAEAEGVASLVLGQGLCPRVGRWSAPHLLGERGEGEHPRHRASSRSAATFGSLPRQRLEHAIVSRCNEFASGWS
jgi:hypothetical protein